MLLCIPVPHPSGISSQPHTRAQQLRHHRRALRVRPRPRQDAHQALPPWPRSCRWGWGGGGWAFRETTVFSLQGMKS